MRTGRDWFRQAGADQEGKVVHTRRSSRSRISIAAILCGEDGQAVILAALCLTMLMGGMALAVDVGYLHYRQRQLQTAADSAAIAAGLELGNCGNTVCANMTTAAAVALKESGITSASITPAKNQCSVTKSSSLAMIINVAPCVLGASDPNNGNANMAEVVLTEPQNTFFGAIFGIRTINLAARAEAGEAWINSAPTPPACLYTKSLEFNSNASLNLQNCGIYDYGNLQTNTNESATATDFLYYGTWSPNNCHKNCTWNLGEGETQPTHTTTATTDPLASQYSTPPNKPGTTYTNVTFNSNSGTNTLNPGYYQGDVNINSNVTVDLTPGLYYFDGSLNVDSNSTLECTTCTGGQGVTLYFNTGQLQANSNSTVQLTAATTGSQTNGAYPNMLLWAGPSASNMEIDSNASSYFSGIIYLPDQTLTLNSNAGVNINGSAVSTALDVNNLMLDSNESFTLNGSNSLLGSSGNPPTLGAFALAE